MKKSKKGIFQKLLNEDLSYPDLSDIKGHHPKDVQMSTEEMLKLSLETIKKNFNNPNYEKLRLQRKVPTPFKL